MPAPYVTFQTITEIWKPGRGQDQCNHTLETSTFKRPGATLSVEAQVVVRVRTRLSILDHTLSDE